MNLTTKEILWRVKESGFLLIRPKLCKCDFIEEDILDKKDTNEFIMIVFIS